MSSIPTVKVESGDSYAIINESDYDPKVHKLLEGEVPSGTQDTEAAFEASVKPKHNRKAKAE